jgi:hypothetical protein
VSKQRLSRWTVGSTLALSLLAGSVLSTPALAADARENAALLRDFIHYVRIDRADLAQAKADALLARLEPPFGTAKAGEGLGLADFVRLVEDANEVARFEEAASGAMRGGELESVASKLLKAFQVGKLEQARSPEQIEKNIALLVGSQRERLVARERLAAAGEYAVPQLLKTMTAKDNLPLAAEARRLLSDMGRQVVFPLVAALPGLDSAGQEQVVAVLAEIPYKTSLPFLYELHQTAKLDTTRAAAERAIARIDGGFDAKTPVSARYLELAEGFYGNSRILAAFPDEAYQILWQYDPSAGLAMVPIRTEVFHEAMAMGLAERGLRLDPDNQALLALWLASNFQREFQSPKDYANPAYASGKRDAMYYAVAAGSGPVKRVLARGIDTNNSALMRKAIAALDRTAGASTMVATEDGRRPLVEALRHADRRVQYDAALAVAAANPVESFDGSERVVPILAGAVRDAGVRYAAVVAARLEEQQSLAAMLRAQGYTVLPPAFSLEEAAVAINEAPAVDVLLIELPAESARDAVAAARATPKLGATAVLAFLSETGRTVVAGAFPGDPMLRTVPLGLSPTQQAEALQQLVDSGGGPISAEEAKAYRGRAIAALRDLAVANSPILQPIDAAPALLGALAQFEGADKLAIAEVLARIDDRRVQQALAGEAAAAEGAERMPLVRAVTHSAKLFGNQLEEQQVSRFVAAAQADGLSDEDATAYAALLGALGVRNNQIVPLIIGAKAG